MPGKLITLVEEGGYVLLKWHLLNTFREILSTIKSKSSTLTIVVVVDVVEVLEVVVEGAAEDSGRGQLLSSPSV